MVGVSRHCEASICTGVISYVSARADIEAMEQERKDVPFGGPRIRVSGTGSSGNCYIIETPDDILIVELGIKFRDILKTINFGEGIRKVRGCLASHL